MNVFIGTRIPDAAELVIDLLEGKDPKTKQAV